MGSEKIATNYDVIIIGGGIVGAGVFRDLSLHNISTLLLDRGDFNSQTSQASSKMLHGGIRYLENADFFLVWEALHEKNLWLKLTPELAKESYFFLPIYKNSKYPLWMVKIGLFLYDLLSWFQNKPRKSMNKKQTVEALPGIKTEGLAGSGIYSDAIVDDSKLGLECIYDALENKNCHAHNYHQVISQRRLADGSYELEVQNTLTRELKVYRAKHLIFATGPFTDQVLKKLDIPWEPKMLLSKGSHLWLKNDSLQIKGPLVLQTKDKRIIFVIPQRKAILVGTTEIPLDANEDIFNIKASTEEVEYLLDCINEYFPSANINREHILSTFAGVRPLVADGRHSRGKTSRKHALIEPTRNVHVIIGGKYTTFRVMAADVAKKVVIRMGQKYQKSLTLKPLRRKSVVDNIHNLQNPEEAINKIITTELPQTSEDILVRRLSAPSIEHCDHPEEIKKLLEAAELKLEAVRKTHNDSGA